MKTRKINKKLKYSRKTFKGGMSQGPEVDAPKGPEVDAPKGPEGQYQQTPEDPQVENPKSSNVKKIQAAIFDSLNKLDPEAFKNITEPMIDAVKRLSKTPYVENTDEDEDEDETTIEDERNDFLQELLKQNEDQLYASQIFDIEQLLNNKITKLDKKFISLNNDQFILIRDLVNKKDEYTIEFKNQLIKMLGIIEKDRYEKATNKTILRPTGRLITPQSTPEITSKPYNKSNGVADEEQKSWM
jgi:hypothetical protein